MIARSQLRNASLSLTDVATSLLDRTVPRNAITWGHRHIIGGKWWPTDRSLWRKHRNSMITIPKSRASDGSRYPMAIEIRTGIRLVNDAVRKETRIAKFRTVVMKMVSEIHGFCRKPRWLHSSPRTSELKNPKRQIRATIEWQQYRAYPWYVTWPVDCDRNGMGGKGEKKAGLRIRGKKSSKIGKIPL